MNTASRMESSSLEDKIQTSGVTAEKLTGWGYTLTYRGKVTVKGKGDMDTYFLEEGPTDRSYKERAIEDNKKLLQKEVRSKNKAKEKAEKKALEVFEAATKADVNKPAATTTNYF